MEDPYSEVESFLNDNWDDLAYIDYNGKVEAIQDEFDVDADTAEGYLWKYMNQWDDDEEDSEEDPEDEFGHY